MLMVRAAKIIQRHAHSLLMCTVVFYIGPTLTPTYAQEKPSSGGNLTPSKGTDQTQTEQDAEATSQETLTTPLLSKDDSEGKQPKRILWIIPNYRAVSANMNLPPLSPKGKFWLATQDSFDYSSFALAGIVAGISQARNSIRRRCLSKVSLAFLC